MGARKIVKILTAGVFIGATVALGLTANFAAFGDADTVGYKLFPDPGSAGVSALQGLDRFLEYYDRIIKLNLSIFAGLGFLMTYGAQKDIRPTRFGIVFLSIGCVYLVAATALALAGTERVLRMIAENYVWLESPFLRATRLELYSLQGLGIAAVGIFGISTFATRSSVPIIAFGPDHNA